MSKIKTIQSKLSQKWTYTIQETIGIFGLSEKFFRRARGCRILVYHGVCQSNPTRFNSLFFTIRAFEKHLQFYKKYFHVLSLSDYYEQRFSKDRFNVCLTFDDGFANNFKYVLPLLERYQIPATFFITGIRDAGYDILWNDFLALAQKFGPSKFEILSNGFSRNNRGHYVSVEGRPVRDLLRKERFQNKAELMKILEPFIPSEIKESMQDYWMQMTSEQIRTLSASPFATIGCHGYYHNDFGEIPVEDVKQELGQAKQFLENIAQREVDALAFPYGSYDREVVNASKTMGFTKLLAAEFLFPRTLQIHPCENVLS